MGVKYGAQYIAKNVEFFLVLMKKLFALFRDLFSSGKKEIKYFKKWIPEAKKKAKNLYDTNIKLGKYHYYYRRYKEANFRFSLVKHCIKGNENRLGEVMYHLGRCAHKLGKLEQAKENYDIAMEKFDKKYLVEYYLACFKWRKKRLSI